MSTAKRQRNLLEIGTRKPSRDPNLDCEAVKLYRQVVHLQLNHIQRAFVAEQIQCNERGLRIWEAVLIEHMARGYNPKNIPFMLKMWANQYYG